MVGEYDIDNTKGIIPRTFEYLFKKIQKIKEEDNSTNFIINIAFIQIYLETIQDLLEPKNIVKIREDPERGVYLENCYWLKVKNIYECKEAYKIGEKNRVTEFTNMNAHSSRSHAILIVNIEQNFIERKNNQHLITRGFLYLVDLAGSERVNKSRIKDIRLEEAKKINYSLSVLGTCIQRLISGNYVPYRDSKLTRILQESLGGNAKTSLIVTISPSNYNADESFSSLNFGMRAMKVKNIPKINKIEDYKSICVKLQEEYDKLMEKYANLKIEYAKVCEENEKFKNGEIFLDLQRKSLRQHINDIGGEFEKKNFDLKKTQNEYEQNLKELEQQYQQVINNKEEENNKIMKDIDKVLIEKEEEIEKLNEEIIKLKEYNNNLIDKNKDLSNEVNDLKKTCDDILIEKDELNNKIILLNNINKENNYILDIKTKDLLTKQNINTNIVNNQNINLILNKLIGDIGVLTEENNKYKEQINILNNYLNEIKNNYEEKLKIVKFENNKTITEIKNYEEKI